jgi:SAM-dependent methyltransferase
MKAYLTDIRTLAFFEEKATSGFWDKHWNTDNLATKIRACKTDSVFIPVVKKHLPKNSLVLEGGCGQAYIVNALEYNGYKAIGIDYAEKTVSAIKDALPELDVRVGDVRELPLNNNELDGYISAGVIEHFWEGYNPIISEMARTIKKGGYLFVSFPYMSFLRKAKAFLHLYSRSTKGLLDDYASTFYQFALNHKHVEKDLADKGFSVVERIKYDGIKGFKDEVLLLRSMLQKIYDGKTCQNQRSHLDGLLKLFAAHGILLVTKKIG